MAVLNSDAYYQSIELFPEEDQAGIIHMDTLSVLTSEQDPQTGEWYETKLDLSTSFEIVDVSARFANDFFVHGYSALGADIIERWTIEPRVGAIAPSRAPAGAAGVAYVTPPVTLPIMGGGGFLPPAQRSGRNVVKRVEVYRGNSLGEIRSIAADPDGRFVLMLTETGGQLHSLDLLGAGGTSLLFDSTQVPDLPTTDLLSPFQHESYGRVFVTAMSFSPTVLSGVSTFFDFNNDGIFDSYESLSREQHSVTYPLASWTSDFTGF